MVPIAWRILWNERTRLLITVSAIGAVVMLLLFLSGIYEGVRQGAISYIARSSATIWACQVVRSHPSTSRASNSASSAASPGSIPALTSRSRAAATGSRIFIGGTN